MENANKNIEIDLMDLCREILKKWKIILLVVLICAILFGAYGVIISNKSKPETAAEIKNLTAEMTNEEKTDVENAARIISSYRTMYKAQKDYCDNSIYQNLDPYAISSIVLSYYVDNGYKVSYPIIAEQNKIIPIVQMYTSVLDNEDFYKNLAKELDYNVEPTYLAEVVSVSIGGTDEKATDSGVFDVIVYADSEELLTKVSDYIKLALSEKTNDVVELYGDHKLLLSSEVTKKIVDTDVAIDQQENLDSLSKITTSIKNVENEFSGNQLTYLKYLVHEEFEKDTNIMMFVGIGIIAGALFSFVYYAIKYMVSNTVKTEKEVESILDTDLFGSISENISYVVSRINAEIKQNGYKSVAIITNVDDENIKMLITLIDSNVSIINNPLQSHQDFETLASCDGALVAVALKESRRDYLYSLSNLCNTLKINIFGSVCR